MTPSEVVLALARTLKEAAGQQAPRDEYHRGQLLSASSLARHLAAEQSSAPGLLSWFREALIASLGPAAESAVSRSDETLGERLRAARRRLEQAGDGGKVGEVVSELLAELRARGDPSGLRGEIHTLLRELCDREVTALARGPA